MAFQFRGIMTRAKGKIAYGMGLFGQLFVGTPGDSTAGDVTAETQYIGIFVHAGIPGSGTFDAIAPTGSLCVDITNAQLYINSGTLTATVWAKIAHA